MGTVTTAQPVWSPVIGAPTEAYWGQHVAEHVVQRFATIAARNSNWTGTVPNGAVCVTVAPDYSMWQRQGSAWVNIGPPLLTSPLKAEGGAQPLTFIQVVNSAVTFMGDVKLSGGDPPTSWHAAHKGYVDKQDNFRVRKSGDTMSGALNIPSGHVTNVANHVDGITNKQYVDTQDGKQLSKSGGGLTGQLDMNNHSIIGLGNATGAGVAASHGWVDNNFTQKGHTHPKSAEMEELEARIEALEARLATLEAVE